jgi:O-antigen/teichoic acid export membrane protein
VSSALGESVGSAPTSGNRNPADPGALALGDRAPFLPTAVGSTIWGKALELSAQVLLVAAVPRVLGPADYGVFALAFTVVSVSSLSMALGGPTLMSRFIPTVSPGEREAVARALLVRLAHWRGAFLSVLLICAIVLAAVAPATFPPEIVLLAAAALVLDVGATLTFQCALALQRTTAWSFRFGVQNAITVATALAGYEAAGVEGAVAGLAIASGAVFAWGSFLVLRPLLRARSGAELPPGALRFGAVHAVGNLFEQITHRGAVVAVAILAGSSVETGFTALAVGIAMAGAYVIWQLFTAQLPGLVAALRDEPDASRAERSLRDLGGISLGAAFAMAAVGICLTPVVAPVVFGDQFEDAVPAMAIALAILPLAPLSALSTQTAALRLLPARRARATGAGMLAFATTAVLAVPHWEATGGALALLAGVAVSVSVSRLMFPEVIDRRLLAAGLSGSALLLALAAVTGAM